MTTGMQGSAARMGGGRADEGVDAATPNAAAAIFVGGGETGAILRALDWAATPLGSVANWPQSLRTAVSVMLASRFPMMIHWGPALIHFYNDGYAAILQGKHPGALGAPALDWWPEIWDQIGPIFEAVWRGETTYFEDTLVLPNRRGHVEECYFTFCHSPIRDESGAVGGVFVTAVETTAHVVSQRRLATLQALTARTSAPGVRDAGMVYAATIAVLRANAHDVPFALLYRWEADDPEAHLVCTVGLPVDSRLAPARLSTREPPSPAPAIRGWPLSAVRGRNEARGAVPVDNPAAAFGAPAGAAPGGAWPEPTRTAMLLPLAPADGPPFGALVLGVSPRRPLDAEHRAFGVAVAEQLAAALDRVRLDAAAHAARVMADAARHAAEDAQQRAEVANRAKSEFLTVMCHELRTPLNAIGGYAELLELGIHGPVTAAQLADLDRIQRAQRHLLGLINGVLNYARIEAGAVHYQLADVPLDEVLATCEALIAPQVRAKALTLRHDAPDRTLRVRADREKLQQVVLNLLSNAVKFTEPGGCITLSSAAVGGADGPAAWVRVADTGIGIAADQLGRAFEPFVQVDARLTRTREGTGLGLAISRDLARGMGGDLTAESTPGVGSTFTLTLPSA